MNKANEANKDVVDRKEAARKLAMRVLTESEARDIAAAGGFVKVGPPTPVKPNIASWPSCATPQGVAHDAPGSKVVGF